jgi:hypothetical protein
MFQKPLGKWVNVDELTPAGKVLTRFEPGEKVKIKGRNFEVQRIQLDPPEIALMPTRKRDFKV